MKLSIPKFKLPNFGVLSSLGHRKIKTSLAIQITDRSLRILELSDTLEPKFEPVFHLWENGDLKEKQKVLKDYVNKYNLAGRDVISVLNTNDGFLQYIRYPATLSRKDLINSIDWAVKRKQAEIGEETFYDYYIIKEEAEDKNIGVVTVFARKDVVNNLQKLIEGAGLNLKILDYEIVALINYGLMENLPKPFSILYVDYDYFVLVSYTGNFINYSFMHINLDSYIKTEDVDILENFFAEVRNHLVVGDILNVYLAGPILEEKQMLDMIMENLPIIGLLDLPNLKPGFLIPYILCRRGREI